MNKLQRVFLARHIDNNPFHVYLTKPINKPDLTGLKLRITWWHDFFRPGRDRCPNRAGRVYTALERGVVDGWLADHRHL